jgi:hypothetical protein
MPGAVAQHEEGDLAAAAPLVDPAAQLDFLPDVAADVLDANGAQAAGFGHRCLPGRRGKRRWRRLKNGRIPPIYTTTRTRLRPPARGARYRQPFAAVKGKARMREPSKRLEGWRVRVPALALAFLMFSQPVAALGGSERRRLRRAARDCDAHRSDGTSRAGSRGVPRATCPRCPRRATILFRMGVEAQKKGDAETAVRLWRGAEELDPWSLSPASR